MTETVRQAVLLGSLAVAAAGLGVAVSLRANRTPRITGSLLAVAGLLGAVACFGQFTGSQATLVRDAMFWLFAAGALIGGVFTVTNRDPVYIALSFALATLGACGLFMMAGAPFLAAATLIVYAGAIIVTFLFVIMLARQQRPTGYDQQANAPQVAIAVSFLMLGVILWNWQADPGEPAQAVSAENVAANHGEPNPLSQPTSEDEFHTMRSLGRSLFGDYLYAVEIAGLLLLIAGIGAIAIAPRRSGGAL
jgi:NADH-quinone oxidoreductase subunit J